MKKNILLLASVIACTGCSADKASTPESAETPTRPLVVSLSKPNILFISIDDLNDFPTFTGRYPDALTPHMDRLAKGGIVFTRAHCQYPVCGPSRASLMTGLSPVALGYESHMKDTEVEKRAAELGTSTLHTYFSKHGYKTMAVGKIFHRHVPEGSVDASGGRGDMMAGLGKLKKNWYHKGTMTDWAAAPERDDQLPDYDAAAWAVEQLQAQHDQPFFLMVGFLRPHVPWYVPQKWFDLYDRDKITLPHFDKNDLDDVPDTARRISVLEEMPRTEWAIENDQWRNIVQAYLASISFVDAQVGKVLDALKASPYAENTIIVLWSDHGYHMGEKNTFQKHSLWERSSHVPLIFAGPMVNASTRCDRIVSLLDIYPTLVDMAGLPGNSANEGRSLLPLIREPEKEWPYPAFTGWKEGSFAMQTEQFRYLRYQDGSEELYDHRTDLNEITNLAQDPKFKNQKDELASQLKNWLASHSAKTSKTKP
jgi:arylsulfatase A-like enzyme